MVQWHIMTDSSYNTEAFGFHPAWGKFCRSVTNARSIEVSALDRALRQQYNAKISNDDPWILEFNSDQDLSFFLLRFS